jgi:S-formylglutathione hydrolase FrmB
MFRVPSRLASSVRRGFSGLVLGASLCALTAGSAQAVTVQQWNTPGGQFVSPKNLFPIDLVNGKLVTNIVLPTGYSSRKCWPVMYLLHGTAGSDAPVSLQWLQIGNGQLLRMHIPAILVIPGSGNTWWTNEWWNGNRHPAFESWVLQDLVPLVAKRLHVCSARRDHAIAGLSMGGYGAIMLASQRPDYFGSAGSFSGVLSPESSNFISIYKQYWNALWGPPDSYYAIGHDPVALVNNLRNTRVFVGVGNGIATAGEGNSLTSQFEEAEFDQEDVTWVARARKAHVSVAFDQHPGTHDALNWLQSLSHMMTWNPFKRVVSHPSHWTFDTADELGTVWGYQYSFDRHHPPTQIIQFSYARHVLTVTGGGTMKLTTPTGQRLTGHIPFQVRAGKVVELRHAAKPHVVGGYEKVVPVKPVATQLVRSPTAPVQVSFTTTQALPAGEEYQVAVAALDLTGSSTCSSTAFARVVQPAVGKPVTVSLSPPSTATTPNTWCPGGAAAAVTIVPKNGPPLLIGTLLGYAVLSLP